MIALQTHPSEWTEGGIFWEVGVPEISDRAEVRKAPRGDGRGQESTEVVVSVTIINGGSQGLGEATARELARRGATGLLLAGRSAGRGEALAAELSAGGTPTAFLEAEMEDVESPKRIIAACDERFGVVHGVVNVAALTDRSTVWSATPDHWDQIMAINVRAPFFVLQGAAELMRREGVRGRSSTSGRCPRTADPPGCSPTACRRVRWP